MILSNASLISEGQFLVSKVAQNASSCISSSYASRLVLPHRLARNLRWDNRNGPMA